MFCKKCGKELKEGEIYCPECGQKQDEEIKEEKKEKPSQKENNFWWGVLGFFVPVAGLILFCVWYSDLVNKLKGKAAGIGALISVIASFSISAIYYVIYMIIIVLGVAANHPEFASLLSFINI